MMLGRSAILTSILLAYLFFYSILTGDRDIVIPAWKLALVMASPFRAAYLFILGRLGRGPNRFALGFAVGLGICFLLLGGLAQTLWVCEIVSAHGAKGAVYVPPAGPNVAKRLGDDAEMDERFQSSSGMDSSYSSSSRAADSAFSLSQSSLTQSSGSNSR